MATQPKGRNARRESFYVAVQSEDSSVSFFDSTAHLGKPMPFSKPKMTCAVRTDETHISFSLLHLTKKTASTIATAPLEIPRGPLAKLDRRADSLGELAADAVVVDYEGQSYQLKISRDANKVASVEMAEGDDVAIELPKSSVKLSMFLRSPGASRTIGIGFIGHLGRPGDPSTVCRLTAMVLHSLSLLLNFRILASIETAEIPTPPSRYSANTRRREETAEVLIPVRLFSADATPVLLGEGTVGVQVDLAHANPVTEKLLYHYQPSPEILGVFEQFRWIIDDTVTRMVTDYLGADEIGGITFDIVLNAVEAGTVERLRAALATIPALDCIPTQWRVRSDV